MKLNDKEVQTNSTSIFQELQSDESQNLIDNSNNSYFIVVSNIFIFITLFLL